ncbi:hypothetical protein STVA_11700 [Allostella vacuolata]|nr:hypothetical protein STVA_11700 [Stella vacuolata]
MLFRKSKVAEVAFYALLAASAAGLLVLALRMDLVVRDAIGPGLYPALVLAALLVLVLVVLAGTVTRRDIRLLSPFPEGLWHDTMLRRAAAGAGRALGQRVQVVANTGVGWFSAVHAGRRAPADGQTMVVVTSETADLAGAEAAAFARQQLVPIGRLWFDPDALVVRENAPWRDLDALFASPEPLRIGVAGTAAAAAPITAWIGDHRSAAVEVVTEPEAPTVLRALAEGRIDLAIVGRSDMGDGAAAIGARHGFRILAMLDEAQGGAGEPGDNGAAGATAADQGFAFVSGRWAGLAMPAGSPAAAVARVQTAFGGGEPGGDSWRAAPTEAFAAFLAGLDRQWRTAAGRDGQVRLPRGKVAGFAVALLGVPLFPWAMDLVGFPVAAFLFLAASMGLLWPSPSVRAAGLIVPVAALVTAALYLLFGDLFYVVFPVGLLWES